MRRACSILLVACLCLSSCELFGTDDEKRSAVGLDHGTQFRYRWTFSELDAARTATLIEQDEFIARVVRDRELNTSFDNLVQVDITSVSTDSVASTIWYEETQDQLVEVASRNTAGKPLVAPKHATLHTGFSAPSSLSLPRIVALSLEERPPVLHEALTDSIIIRQEPRIVFEFPLEFAEPWVSFTDPFVEIRRIVGVDTVTVEAGTFPCTLVKTEIPLDIPFLGWFDCVSEEGLILRIIERPFTGPPPFILREHLELISRDG
ncbi:MAG: hypothetical protein ACE5G0_02890 [Rhodothermales bacterium]